MGSSRNGATGFSVDGSRRRPEDNGPWCLRRTPTPTCHWNSQRRTQSPALAYTRAMPTAQRSPPSLGIFGRRQNVQWSSQGRFGLRARCATRTEDPVTRSARRSKFFADINICRVLVSSWNFNVRSRWVYTVCPTATFPINVLMEPYPPRIPVRGIDKTIVGVVIALISGVDVVARGILRETPCTVSRFDSVLTHTEVIVARRRTIRTNEKRIGEPIESIRRSLADRGKCCD
jgi:hypothetical protein